MPKTSVLSYSKHLDITLCSACGWLNVVCLQRVCPRGVCLECLTSLASLVTDAEIANLKYYYQLASVCSGFKENFRS